MFSKEHYEVLVEVEGVGEPPEQFSNATAFGQSAPVAATRPTGKTPKQPKHRTLSEQAEEAGVESKPRNSRMLPPGGSASEQAEGTGKTGSRRTPEAHTPGAESADKKDAGLQSLLDEARTQLNSGTEAAAADLEAQLAAMGVNSGEPATSPGRTPPPGASGVSRSQTPGLGTPLRQGSPLLDARLQGVAAPGSGGGILNRPVIDRASPAARISMDKAADLGFPANMFPAASLDNGVTVDDFVAELPKPVELLEKPGSTIVVIGAAPIALSVVETAQRLAGRLGEEGYCVLGGPKTTLPGEELRARSAEELRSIMGQRPGLTCVLALADSLIEAHRRTMSKLISVIYVDQTWAVVDGRTPVERIRSWLKGLPDALHPDTLAVQRVWESQCPGELFELGVPIGMLDGVPARGEAWKMLLEDVLSR